MVKKKKRIEWFVSYEIADTKVKSRYYVEREKKKEKTIDNVVPRLSANVAVIALIMFSYSFFCERRVYQQSNIQRKRHGDDTTSERPTTNRTHKIQTVGEIDTTGSCFSHRLYVELAETEHFGWEFFFFFFPSSGVSPISDRSIVESILDYTLIERKGKKKERRNKRGKSKMAEFHVKTKQKKNNNFFIVGGVSPLCFCVNLRMDDNRRRCQISLLRHLIFFFFFLISAMSPMTFTLTSFIALG